MREIRPSTWALLGVLTLFIFGPLFLLDIDPVQQLEPDKPQPVGPGGPVRPMNPHAKDNRPAANNSPAQNQPEPPPRENGLVE